MSGTELDWFKSSYSGGGGNNCVEVAMGPEIVRVRDSRDLRVRPLAVQPAAWSRFATSVARDSA